MDIKQAIVFGLARGCEDTVSFASKLRDNGFGIEVVRSKEAQDALKGHGVQHIITNSVEISELFFHLTAWCERSLRHCAVLVFPYPVALTEKHFQIVSHAR